ncbi:MAG: Hpt domain-containing protein, partial [bacterium]|nr:Hpt domain-containing protein [bacterium]
QVEAVVDSEPAPDPIPENPISRSREFLFSIPGVDVEQDASEEPVSKAASPAAMLCGTDETHGAGDARGKPLGDVLDHAMLDGLLADEAGRELVGFLVESYESGVPKFLDDANLAVQEGDWDGLASAAHKFVSSNGSVGAVRCAEVLKSLEVACRKEDLDQVHDLLESARMEISLALVELKELQTQ